MFRPQQECNSTIHNTTNTRIYDRNLPSQFLQPYLSTRPVMTKYSLMPIVDPRAPIKIPLKQMPTYNTTQIFNPGNTTSPWSGFASSINKESELRNQIYSLQKCSQSVYVPNSTSDLYAYNFQTPYTPNQHELLFKNETFDNFNPNPAPKLCGSGIFLNSTRCQVKDITNQKC